MLRHDAVPIRHVPFGAAVPALGVHLVHERRHGVAEQVNHFVGIGNQNLAHELVTILDGLLVELQPRRAGRPWHRACRHGSAAKSDYAYHDAIGAQCRREPCRHA